jgi:phage terminase large subunit
MEIAKKLEPLIDTPHTHNVIQGGRGGTKSRAVASLLIRIMSKQPLNVMCAREVQKSLADSSFAMMRDEIYRQGLGGRFNILESRGVIVGGNGSRAIFIGLKEHTVDSIKSYEGFHWAWIEEAQSVSERSLNVLIPTLRHDKWFKVDLGKGKEYKFPLRMFVYTMNPYTWDDPINYVLPDSRDDVQRINVNYYDNPWFPESLESERIQAEKTMPEDEYNRIWEGVPFEDTERVIMTRQSVKDAMERKASADGGIVVGADIARFGDDRTVFIKREGMQVIDTKVLNGKDTQEVARRLHDFAGGGRIVIDDTGVGGGVTDKLHDLGDKVSPINFGGSAIDKKKYPDVISEMWFNLADNISDIGLPHNDELLMELSSRHYKYTQDERRKVESKEEYRKRTGRRSPDIADAVILCFYDKKRGQVSKVSAGRLGL